MGKGCGRWRAGVAALAVVWGLGVGALPARAQFGLAVGGVGPINRAMGGAATAAPLDAAGALYWNPATITGLGRSEMEFGNEFLIPRTYLSSRVPAGAIVPGVYPPATSAGSTGANNGVYPLPTVGLVYQPKDSDWTFGFGAFLIGGFGVNYPSRLHNPILSPQPPFGLGAGPVYAQYQAYQFAPTVAYRLSDKLSIGLQGNFDMANLQFNPGLFAPPTLVPTPLGSVPNYASAVQGRYRWGGGFQVGLFWNDPDSDWSFGASFKSPQWFESYTFNSVTIGGRPAEPKLNLDFPLIVSAGTSYTGFERWVIASDIRFLDYRDTAGFNHAGFGPFGLARGLGWQNVFASATGVQYQVTDALAWRVGYTFSLNPAGGAVTTFNIASPTIIQHTVSTGFSYDVNRTLRLSLAYVHFFQNSISGPIIEPTGPIRGSRVGTSAVADSILFGASVAF